MKLTENDNLLISHRLAGSWRNVSIDVKSVASGGGGESGSSCQQRRRRLAWLLPRHASACRSAAIALLLQAENIVAVKSICGNG